MKIYYNYVVSFISTVLALIAMVTILISCQKQFNDLDERLGRAEQNISELQSAVTALREAYKDGKIIKSVDPVTGTPGGWKITFSDNSEITVTNGKDGITPFLKTDAYGLWTVSYDNGKTFTALTDADGNPVRATGEDGAEGLSTRIVTGTDGNYTIQCFYPSDPETVISETATPYTADASRVIAYMSQNPDTHEITITLADGNVLRFNLFTVSPTGVTVLRMGPITFTGGDRDSVTFRINPSNAWVSLKPEDGQVVLDRAGELKTRASYVNPPEGYRLAEVRQDRNPDTGKILEGQYVAVIEDTGTKAFYDDAVCIVLNFTDGGGNGVQLSSNPFEVKCNIIGDVTVDTGLPVAYLTTPAPVTSKDEWIPDASMVIVTPGTFDILYRGTLSVKGRGNSTWNYPKKPYALKLDKKSEMLGMKKHKRWCLLANWMDRTLMRNAVAFEISRHTGLDWTPDGRFVEVILNGEHLGNYYLCEQIKVDKNRVNVAEPDPADVSGGYIFELDTNYDEANKFRPTRSNLPWMFSDPDEVTAEQFGFVTGYVEKMEAALYDEQAFARQEFLKYMDLESFADWWIAVELTGNAEPNGPKSVYLHKDAGEPLKAGPVWDFDWHTFTPDRQNRFVINEAVYYKQLFGDQTFRDIVRERLESYRPRLERDIPAFIDSLAVTLKASDAINSKMWPIGGSRPNYDEDISFNEATARIKSVFLAKLDWLYSQFVEEN